MKFLFLVLEKDWMPHVAAKNMNRSSLNEIQPLTMVCINLKVAQQMAKVAAFAKALPYLNKALEKLVKISNHWEKQYELFFQLYQIVVNIKLCLSNYNCGYTLGSYVID